jgi:DNA repair and recombination protein RAD52
VVTNPFEERPHRISEYTAQEIATLQSRLERQLGPEYISARAGPSGQKVHYVAAEKCIQLANEVFGFNGWSSSIQNIQVDFVDEKSDGRVSLGLSVVMRVSLRDGTYHEDIGYGQIENCKSKATAFEKAKKEGTTDGLKRALRNFGNVLGNCIYDKEYLKKVVRIKPTPVRFDEANLHRAGDLTAKETDCIKIKKEKIEGPRATAAQPDDFDLLDALGGKHVLALKLECDVLMWLQISTMRISVSKRMATQTKLPSTRESRTTHRTNPWQQTRPPPWCLNPEL